jgi:hypothetical protein
MIGYPLLGNAITTARPACGRGSLRWPSAVGDGLWWGAGCGKRARYLCEAPDEKLRSIQGRGNPDRSQGNVKVS